MWSRLASLAARLLLCLGLLPHGLGQVEPAVPLLERRVTDLTGTLTPQQQDQLEQKLAAFEQRKGSQIAVLIVPSTQPETIEQYSIRAVEQWKLGRKGVDDGALLLVAKDDRALRIEVGYGLEGAMPDAVANRIIDEIIVPRFKAGDFDGGVSAGLDSMIKVVDGEPLPPPQQRVPPGGFEGGAGLGTLLVIGLVMVFVVGGILRAMFGRLPGALITGGLTGVIAWMLVASLLAAGVVGLIAFAFSLLGGMPGGRRGGYRPGGWGGGLPPGGGGWGGGGGWSGGGGGGFGGGGASGRW